MNRSTFATVVIDWDKPRSTVFGQDLQFDTQSKLTLCRAAPEEGGKTETRDSRLSKLRRNCV